MSIRKVNAQSRRTLIRTCFQCGQIILTRADTPWIRQLCNVDGKKQYTAYFCSQSCMDASYTYNMDGRAEERKRAKDNRTPEQIREKNRRYYLAHAETERARQKRNYYSRTPEENAAINKHNHAKYKMKQKEMKQKGMM